MSDNKGKKMSVSAIENGTVIDHIPASKVFQVIRILELDKFDNQVTFGTNLYSKKFGKKGIIKVSNRHFAKHEISKIAIAAPTATLIEIQNYEVVGKKSVELPTKLEGIVRCFNPKCITNLEQVPQKFSIINGDEIALNCHYCEKITKYDDIEFL